MPNASPSASLTAMVLLFSSQSVGTLCLMDHSFTRLFFLLLEALTNTLQVKCLQAGSSTTSSPIQPQACYACSSVREHGVVPTWVENSHGWSEAEQTDEKLQEISAGKPFSPFIFPLTSTMHPVPFHSLMSRRAPNWELTDVAD